MPAKMRMRPSSKTRLNCSHCLRARWKWQQTSTEVLKYELPLNYPICCTRLTEAPVEDTGGALLDGEDVDAGADDEAGAEDDGAASLLDALSLSVAEEAAAEAVGEEVGGF